MRVASLLNRLLLRKAIQRGWIGQLALLDMFKPVLGEQSALIVYISFGGVQQVACVQNMSLPFDIIGWVRGVFISSSQRLALSAAVQDSNDHHILNFTELLDPFINEDIFLINPTISSYKNTLASVKFLIELFSFLLRLELLLQPLLLI